MTRQTGPSSILLAIALVLPIPGAGCGERREDGTAPQALVSELPRIELRDDTPNLLLTWIDDKGDTHVTLRPAEVPAEGKALVRVIFSDREDGTRDMFYVADLGQKGADGSYAVRTMPRREWEAVIDRRRAAHLATITPPPPPAPPPSGPGAQPAPGTTPPGGPAASGVTVIIYGAAWCKPCHEAADYLRAKGANVISKDIEESPAAATEMQEKLARANQRGGSIPIIDVRGQILVGFSPSALDRALARAASGTVL
jgi:glutaredoxin